MNRKRICLAAVNSPLTYSGGRYAAWILAEALAALGHDVVYWTNARALVSQDFRNFPAHDKIRIHIDPFFNSPPTGKPFDVAWVVPHFGKVWIYHHWLKYLAHHAERRIMTNYETPNWYAAAGQTEIDNSNWAGSELLSRFCQGIVSCLELSSVYARQFYTSAGNAQFLTVPLAINSIEADRAQGTPRVPRRIFFTTRISSGSSAHKGGRYAFDFLGDEFAGYELFLLVGGRPGAAEVRELTEAAGRHRVGLKLLRGISDREKFESLASSSVSVFLSAFEGYGYPPVEALYCGVPCVAFDLPNYAETCGSGLTRIPQGEIGEVKRRVLEGDFFSDPTAFARAREIGSFDAYCARVELVLDAAAQVSVDRSRWPESLSLLAQFNPPRSLREYVKEIVRSKLPISAARWKWLIERFR